MTRLYGDSAYRDQNQRKPLKTIVPNARAGKREEQQAMLALHRMRMSLIKFRTVQVNQLRGLLYEFGVTLKGGQLAGLSEMQQRMAEIEETLPGMLFEALKEQL